MDKIGNIPEENNHKQDKNINQEHHVSKIIEKYQSTEEKITK